jgi:hypothetical protein
VGLAVDVGPGVIVGVFVTVGVAVAVGVDEAVAVGVGVVDAVALGVGLGQGFDTQPTMSVVSTRQPSLAPLVSLAIRQRNLLLKVRRAGRLTTVVTKPSELPLHA